VSIVVPAKDEAEHIETCVRRLLAQDYPNFEVVVVDDRSTDATREIVDRLAGELSDADTVPLRVVHVDHLPEGWLGKCHALHVGTRPIGSPWVLFVDSDVSLSPDALHRAISVAVERGYDAVSMLTRLDARSFWEGLMIPVCGSAWATMFLISWTNDDGRRTAAANGQFFLVRREAYEAVGGHAAVKQEIVEDVALMRRLKSAGHKCRLFLGGHLGATRMHATLGELRRGWGRIFAGTAGYRPWRLLAALGVVIVSGLSVYPALAYAVWQSARGGDWQWPVAAGLHWTLMTAFLAHCYAATRCPRWHALVPFVSFPVLLWLLVEGLRRCADRRFEWRGTAVRIDRPTG
jgi:glycosyltransferase involved in cell wall biosynthesis